MLALPISKLAKGEAGTIIDIKEDSVIIFHGNSFDKFYCKISIDQYRKEMKEKIGTETVSPFKPYESIFLPLGTTHPKEKNIRDTVTIMKMKCDLLDIVKDDHHWEIQHCRELKVKRDMTELIFFNIPAQAEGFPCIYKYEILTRNSEAAKQEQNALDKLLNVVDKIVSAITECKVEIKKIEPGKPEFIEKEIMENYTRVSSLAELEAKFPERGDGGFDD